MSLAEAVEALLERQLREWDTARNNYAALRDVRVKWVDVDGERYKVQFNPARIVSSGAKVDAATLKVRRCFLCAANRPVEQEALPFGDHYDILVNPFPIFPRHLTIVERRHEPQSIGGRFGDMVRLAQELPDYTIFYNGPRCGASAPDHAHFQAGCRGFMPIEESWRTMEAWEIATDGTARLLRLKDARSPLLIESADYDATLRLFDKVFRSLAVPDGDYEPMLNLLCNYTDGVWLTFIFLRTKHRPDCYYAEGEANLLCSPASVDMGGAFIIPQEKDFEKIDATWIAQMLREVCGETYKRQ
jgi:hypothetical protein